MTATFDIYWDFGTTPTSASLTNLRFNTADNNVQDTTNPCVIPATGTNYSFWKHIYMRCSAAPATKVDNVKFYSDGALAWGTGIAVYVGDGVQTKNSAVTTGYDQATGTVGTTGDRMDSGANKHANVSARTSVFTYTSGAPRTVTISESGTQIDAIGETTDYLVLQLEIGATATSGTKAAETLTWQYDEI